MKFIITSVFALFMMAAQPALAQNRKAAPLDNYSTTPASAKRADIGDGCGLGWQVTQKRTMLATTTRGTTNAFVPPTFGMTSGTIGCDQHPFAKKETSAVNFVATNYEPLMLEMAQGQGEYLAAFGRTLGCNDSAINAFGKMSQSHFSEIFSTDSSVQMYKNVKNQIQADAFLSSACAI